MVAAPPLAGALASARRGCRSLRTAKGAGFALAQLTVLASCRIYRQPSPQEQARAGAGSETTEPRPNATPATEPAAARATVPEAAIELPGAAAADALRLWTLNRVDALAESAVRPAAPVVSPLPQRFAFLAWGLGGGGAEPCVPALLEQVRAALEAGASPEGALAGALVLAVGARWAGSEQRVFALLRGTDGHVGSVQGDPQAVFSRERLLSAWRRRAALGGAPLPAASVLTPGRPPEPPGDVAADAGSPKPILACGPGALSGPVVLGAVGADSGLALAAAAVANPATDDAWPYLAQPATLFRELQPNQLLVLVSDCPAHLGPNLEAPTAAAGRVEPSGCQDAFIEFSVAGVSAHGASILFEQRSYASPSERAHEAAESGLSSVAQPVQLDPAPPVATQPSAPIGADAGIGPTYATPRTGSGRAWEVEPHLSTPPAPATSSGSP